MEQKAIISVTESAIKQIKSLLQKKENNVYGIKISLKTKGCTGLSYAITYANEKQPFDEEVIVDSVHILIDSKAVLYLLGTEMDFQSSDLESGFTFKNPNEKGRCGCGKSFHV